jgi:hypothetical protein
MKCRFLLFALFASTLAGCDRIALGAQKIEGDSPPAAAAVEVPVREATPSLIWEISKDPGQLAASVRARRGSVRTLLENGTSQISVDAATADGPYIAFSVEGDLPQKLSGRELVIELDASAPVPTGVEVQYHTLNGGGSPWVTVQLTNDIQTHRISLTPPVEQAPLDIDELRIRTAGPESTYHLSGLRIGYFE